jgi:hypothetical protein
MKKTSARSPRLQPLADGQVWHMPKATLRVDMVGKLLVHYKLGKPNVVRVACSCTSIKAVQKLLIANKAVLA